MDIFVTFATDDSKETDGVVVFLNDGDDLLKDPWIKVARMNNVAYSEAVSESWSKLNTAKKQQRLSEEEVKIRSKNGMVEVLADTILVGFGNLEFQGKPLANSREARIQLLRIKDFAELVVTHAQNTDLYRVEQVQADAGN